MQGVDTTRRPFVLVRELTRAGDLQSEDCRADAQPQELTAVESQALLDRAADFDDRQPVVFSGGDGGTGAAQEAFRCETGSVGPMATRQFG
jgi:MoaA/NifB/PqqE/SkfB family radical SAM enzyme